MSNVSNAHTVVTYTGTEKPFTGQRLIKRTTKVDKTTKVKPDNKCVSVPFATISDADLTGVFKAYVLGFIQDTQDAVAKALIGEGATQITDDQINLSACMAFLDAESEGNRLTKEMLEGWFDENVSTGLMVAFANKLGVSDTPSDAETAKLEKIVADYRAKIAGLAGGKTFYPVKIRTNLLTALNTVDAAADTLGERLIARLEKMAKEDDTDMMGL